MRVAREVYRRGLGLQHRHQLLLQAVCLAFCTAACDPGLIEQCRKAMLQ